MNNAIKAFLDADDYYIDNALEKLYCLAERAQLDFVKGRFCFWIFSHSLGWYTGCR